MSLARHAQLAVRTAVKEDMDLSSGHWLAVVKDGCFGAPVCEKNLLKNFGAEIADELAAIVEDVGGDMTDSQVTDARTLPNLICAPDSITAARGAGSGFFEASSTLSG